MHYPTSTCSGELTPPNVTRILLWPPARSALGGPPAGSRSDPIPARANQGGHVPHIYVIRFQAASAPRPSLFKIESRSPPRRHCPIQVPWQLELCQCQ